MLMDYELNTRVNLIISSLVSQAKEYGAEIDMIVSETDKYENTRDEVVTYGLGCSKGLKSERYYFNALNDETSEFHQLADMYYNEPVRYYENLGKADKYTTMGGMPISFHIQVETFRRIITVYEVAYGAKNEPVFTKVDRIDLKPSKFSKKIKERVGV